MTGITYSKSTICFSQEEVAAIEEYIEESEFQYDREQRLRSNGEFPERIRFIIQQELMDDE